jgi:soluble lytic murein transglycosylase-like protein
LNAAESKYGIPPDLLVRLAYEESHFRPDIISGQTVSSAGALGIMQLVPRFHPNVNPLDPYAAIDYAAGFLRSLYDQFGSWTLAVAAYNAGPGNVQKAGNTVPPFPETLKYVADIIGDVNAAGGQVA